jgi:hypothetical protein
MTRFVGTTLFSLLFLHGMALGEESPIPPRLDAVPANIKEMTASIEGQYSTIAYNRWRLMKGAALWITSRDDGTQEMISAKDDGVDVQCGNAGILTASGQFILEATRTDGTLLRFPRRFPTLSQNLDLPRNPQFIFTKAAPGEIKEKNWVSVQGSEFSIRGIASAEALHPARNGSLRLLIAVAGTTSETLVITDLASYLKFDADPFPFWRAARADLDEEDQNFRSIKIEDTRVGAEGYKSFQKETLSGLQKIREGYQLLQRNLYSQKVIEKMLQEGVPIPRLTLTDVTIVCGDLAHTIRPFVNWRGEGRVLVDRARLVTPGVTPSIAPPYEFVLDDLSHHMIEDTRLRVQDGQSFIETRRPIDPGWKPRADIQFDLDAKRFFIQEGEVFRFSDLVDATGFFIRKEIAARGEVRMSDLIVGKNSVEYRFRPQSEDPKAAIQFAKFMDLRRFLFHPDPARRKGLLPPPFDSPEMSGFVSDGLDQLVAAMFQQGVKEIIGLHTSISNPQNGVWEMTCDVLGEGGQSVQSSLRRSIPGVHSLEEAYKRVEKNKSTSDWLDLHWE